MASEAFNALAWWRRRWAFYALRHQLCCVRLTFTALNPTLCAICATVERKAIMLQGRFCLTGCAPADGCYSTPTSLCLIGSGAISVHLAKIALDCTVRLGAYTR